MKSEHFSYLFNLKNNRNIIFLEYLNIYSDADLESAKSDFIKLIDYFKNISKDAELIVMEEHVYDFCNKIIPNIFKFNKVIALKNKFYYLKLTNQPVDLTVFDDIDSFSFVKFVSIHKNFLNFCYNTNKDQDNSFKEFIEYIYYDNQDQDFSSLKNLNQFNSFDCELLLKAYLIDQR